VALHLAPDEVRDSEPVFVEGREGVSGALDGTLRPVVCLLVEMRDAVVIDMIFFELAGFCNGKEKILF
jgi:hypothetical protein